MCTSMLLLMRLAVLHIWVFHLFSRKGSEKEGCRLTAEKFPCLDFSSLILLLKEGEQQANVVICTLQARDYISLLAEPSTAGSFPKFLSHGDVEGNKNWESLGFVSPLLNEKRKISFKMEITKNSAGNAKTALKHLFLLLLIAVNIDHQS